MARLLVVEDNPTTSRVLCLYLSGAGHRVREAASLAEGVFEAVMFQPEVIVLSASSPPEAILQFMAESRKWEIQPKVVLTALRGNETGCQELLKAGVSDYVVKSSFFQNTLIEKVDQALAGQETEVSVPAALDPERPLLNLQDRPGKTARLPVQTGFAPRKSGRKWPPKGSRGLI